VIEASAANGERFQAAIGVGADGRRGRFDHQESPEGRVTFVEAVGRQLARCADDDFAALPIADSRFQRGVLGVSGNRS